MDQYSIDVLTYLAPITFALLVTMGVGIFVYQRRRSAGVMGAQSFAVAMLLESSWILGFIFEQVSPRLEGKIFWDNFQWIGTLLAPIPLLSFALAYTGRSIRRPRLFWSLLAIYPVFTIIFIFSNPSHGLALLSQRLVSGYPFDAYTYNFSIPLWIGSGFIYFTALPGIYFLIKQLRTQKDLYRTQTFIVMTGFVIPLFSGVIILSGITLGPNRDISPYAFALGNLVVAIGLFRYRIFDIVPIARDRVFESMEDGVIVVDEKGRLLDLNESAKNFLGKPDLVAIGQPLEIILQDLPLGLNLKNPDHAFQKEVTITGQNGLRVLDVRVSQLFTQRRLSGFTVILHDITDHKNAEIGLKQAYAEMEHRVDERTAELQETVVHLEEEIQNRQAAELARIATEKRFQTVIEQSSEAFLLLDVEGRIIVCNPAYETLTGKRREDVLGNYYWEVFYPLFSPESRHPKRKEFFKNIILEGIQTGKSPYFGVPIEGTLYREDGTIRYITQSVFPVQTEEGNLMGSVTRDITQQKTAEMAREKAMQDLEKAYDETIESWSLALDLREHETAGHSRRVVDLTIKLAKSMGIPESELVHFRRGALLHDIGKMGIPDNILQKPDALDADEWIIMRWHPVHAYNLLSRIPFLRSAMDIPYCHHEKWDGSGYPRGLKGTQIPLAARIFAIVDVWEALGEDRYYRKAWSSGEAKSHIQSNSGSHFDPDVVEAFLRLLERETEMPENNPFESQHSGK